MLYIKKHKCHGCECAFDGKGSFSTELLNHRTAAGETCFIKCSALRKKTKKEVEKELMRISAIIRFELLSAIISPDLLLCESDKARGWNLNFDNGEFHYFSTISLSSTI